MKIATNFSGNWEEKESLWDAFGLDKKLKKRQESAQKLAYVFAFVGGGGKTSCLYRLAAEGVKRGKTMIVMTTTRMLSPREHCIFLENGRLNFEQVRQKLSEDKIIIVGDKINEKKMSFVGEESYQKLLKMADIILVEADGSRHFPIKVPASHEPVIPSKIDEIICICGLSCYAKRASDVCFRLEQAKKIRKNFLLEEKQMDQQALEEWIIREKDIMYLMREGFIKPLRETQKNAKISMMLTQTDTNDLEKIGTSIFDRMKEEGFLIRELPPVSEYKEI